MKKTKAKKQPKVSEEDRKSSFKFLVCNGFVYFICFMAFTVIGVVFAVQLKDVENENSSFRAWHKIYIGSFVLATVSFVLVVLICCAKRHENRGNRQEVNGTIGVIYLMLWVAFFGCCAAGGFLGSFIAHTNIFPGCDKPSTTNQIYDTCFLHYVPHTIAFILFFVLFFFVMVFGCYQRSDRAEKLVTPQEDLDAVKEQREKVKGHQVAARWRQSAKIMNERGFVKRSRISKITPLPPLIQNGSGNLVFSDAVEEIMLATRIDRENHEYIPKVTYIKKKEDNKDNILKQPLPPLPVLPKTTSTNEFKADYPTSPNIKKSFPDENGLVLKTPSDAKKNRKEKKSKPDSQTDETSGYTSIDEMKTKDDSIEQPDDIVTFCSKECLESFQKSETTELKSSDVVTPSDLLIEKASSDRGSSEGTSSGTSDAASTDYDTSKSQEEDETEIQTLNEQITVDVDQQKENVVSTDRPNDTSLNQNNLDIYKTELDQRNTSDITNQKDSDESKNRLIISSADNVETIEKTEQVDDEKEQQTHTSTTATEHDKPVVQHNSTDESKFPNTDEKNLSEAVVAETSQPEAFRVNHKPSDTPSTTQNENDKNSFEEKPSPGKENQQAVAEGANEDKTVTSSFIVTQKTGNEETKIDQPLLTDTHIDDNKIQNQEQSINNLEAAKKDVEDA